MHESEVSIVYAACKKNNKNKNADTWMACAMNRFKSFSLVFTGLCLLKGTGHTTGSYNFSGTRGALVARLTIDPYRL